MSGHRVQVLVINLICMLVVTLPNQLTDFFLHYLIRKYTNTMSANRVVLCSAIISRCTCISPRWSQLPEAPTLRWRDESLMASGFHIGDMFLSCVLYPSLYYMYVYINMAAFSLSVSSQYLFVLGTWYSCLLPVQSWLYYRAVGTVIGYRAKILWVKT